MLLDLLSDVVGIDDVLFIVKSGGAVSEVRSNHLGIRQKDKWITLGDNDGPADMHVNAESIGSAEFVEEPRPGRTSFSVRFFNRDGQRVLAAFFTRMYDPSGAMIPERKALYDGLHRRYPSKIQF